MISGAGASAVRSSKCTAERVQPGWAAGPGSLLASRPHLHVGLCLTGQRPKGSERCGCHRDTAPSPPSLQAPSAGRSTEREQGQGPKQASRRAVQEPLLAGPW